MPDILGNKRRQGGQGRIPDSRAEEYEKYIIERYSCPPAIAERLYRFCEDEERAKSWVVQKALDMYLTSKGY